MIQNQAHKQMPKSMIVDDFSVTAIRKFADISSRHGFASGIEAMRAEVGTRFAIRNEFMAEVRAMLETAVTDRSPEEKEKLINSIINGTIALYSSCARVSTWQKFTSQAASAVFQNDTQKIPVFDIFEGGKFIIESGMLMNGDFGKCLGTDDMTVPDAKNAAADISYVIEHSMHESSPLPPYIFFMDKCRTTAEFDKLSDKTLAHRRNVKKHLSGYLGNTVGKDRNYLLMGDEVHPEGGAKFRMLCAVFDMEAGKLMLASNKRHAGPAREFVEWASEDSTLRDILSCSDGTLSLLKESVAKLGLLEKFANAPTTQDPAFRPWAETSDFAKTLMKFKNNGSEDGWYTLANQIWRLAIIQWHVKNVSAFQEAWGVVKGTLGTSEHKCTVSCNDGRTPADAKVLGVTLSQHEFFNLLSRRNIEEVEFKFHTYCGFILAASNLNKDFKALEEALRRHFATAADSEGFSEYGRSMDFFRALLKDIKNNLGRTTNSNLLLKRKYLPPEIISELQRIMVEKASGKCDSHNHAGEKSESTRIAEFIYSVFLGESETYRAVIRRAFESPVFTTGPSGFPTMPAAERVLSRVSLFEEGERQEAGLTDKRVNNLIVEELANDFCATYRDWAEKWRAETNAKLQKEAEAAGKEFVPVSAPLIRVLVTDLATGRDFYPKTVPAFQLEAERSGRLTVDDIKLIKEFITHYQRDDYWLSKMIIKADPALVDFARKMGAFELAA